MLFSLAIAALFGQVAATPPTPAPPAVREIASGVFLAPDSDYEGQGPDGNSVLFRTRDGFVLVDTGRHDWHVDTLMDFADRADRPIVAMINTHWHLDHSSGNGRVRARYPDVQLYASNA